MTTYSIAKQVRSYLEAELAAIADTFPPGSNSGPMGKTPDAIRTTPEWQTAHRRYWAAHDALRAHNVMMSKRFKREIKAERDERRNAMAAG